LWKIRCRIAARFPRQAVGVLRRVPAFDQRKCLCGLLGLPVSRRLGRLRQATVRRTRARPALFGSLYAPRGHFQPSHSLGQRVPGDLPMERLRTPQQATHFASDLRGISAPLLAAHLAERISTHSLLRLAGQSPTEQTASGLSRPPSAGGTTSFRRA